MESKIGLVLMIGLPGSGKTTLVNKFSLFMNDTGRTESEYNIQSITYDEMIPVSVQCGEGDVSWKTARDKVLEKVRYLLTGILDINKQCSSKTLIIVDDNMYYRSMRYEYFQLARMYGLSFCQLYVAVNIHKAIERNSQRPFHSSVPEEVIHRMSARLQPPEPLHNTWERWSLTVSSETTEMEELYNFVSTSLDHIVEPVAIAAAAVQQSAVHKADVGLRKLVGQLMQDERGGDRTYMRAKAAALNAKRNQVLHRLRAGDVTLPDENVLAFLEQQLGMDDV